MVFTCQRCRQPLRIDDSLSTLDQASADMLIGPLVSEEQHEIEAQKHRSLLARPVPVPISSRLIGIKPSSSKRTAFPTTSSQSKHNSINSNSNSSSSNAFPASSDSFVVLPAIKTQATSSTVNRPNSPKASHAITAATADTSSPSSAVVKTLSTANATATTTTALQATNPIMVTSNVEDPNWSRNNTLSHRLKVANRVFDIMSSKSSVDHPMCQECTDMLLESLEKQMSDVGRERDCYIEFMKKVKDSKVTKEEEDDLASQVEELKLAEEEADAEMKKLQEEENKLDSELERLEEEMKDLNRQEGEFWEKSNEYQINLQNFQNERDSVNLKYDHDVKQYERLQKTVVYNDAFCISHDGPFGTINGFRLGRLGTHPVEWNEINAAWGQTLLLLYTVASKLKFQFKLYRLVPMGSFSRVEKIDGDSVVSYELYGSGDFGMNRFLFLNRRFDHAMVAVLNCLKQLADFAEDRDGSLRLPYRINKDKIGDLSIRIQFNQDELWTKALKYMLTNMKWILVFASRANISSVEPTASSDNSAA